MNNPYQFDQTFVNHIDNYRQQFIRQTEEERLERANALIFGNAQISPASSVRERPFSVRKTQCFEYTNRTPFTENGSFPNMVKTLALGGEVSFIVCVFYHRSGVSFVHIMSERYRGFPFLLFCINITKKILAPSCTRTIDGKSSSL